MAGNGIGPPWSVFDETFARFTLTTRLTEKQERPRHTRGLLFWFPSFELK